MGEHGMLSLSASAFSTHERETYDIQGQYWLDETHSIEQLGVGTYMEHARNRLNSTSNTLKLAYEHRTATHHLQTGLSWRHEHIDENAREWEYRDSSGYSVPHTGNDLQFIYHMKSRNEISSNHMELYAQDTWRRDSRVGILSVNYGARLSYWDWNGEWLFSPRMTALASKSIQSNILLTVNSLAQTLITGINGCPAGVPLPVVKTQTAAPPAAIPATEAELLTAPKI